MEQIHVDCVLRSLTQDEEKWISSHPTSQGITIRASSENQIQFFNGDTFSFDSVDADIDSYLDPIVQNILAGRRISVISLGTSGSGKSKVMYEDDWAIVPYFIRLLFETIPLAHASFLEFSRDCRFVRDLFSDGEGAISIGLHPRYGTQAVGATTVLMSDPDTAVTTITEARSRRKMKGSHTVLRLFIGDVTATFVDTSGSIPYPIRAVTDAIVREAESIPYLDTPLTAFLADSFGGHSATSVVLCLSPCGNVEWETFDALRYSQRLRRVMNTVVSHKLIVCGTGSGCSPSPRRNREGTLDVVHPNIELLRDACTSPLLSPTINPLTAEHSTSVNRMASPPNVMIEDVVSLHNDIIRVRDELFLDFLEESLEMWRIFVTLTVNETWRDREKQRVDDTLLVLEEQSHVAIKQFVLLTDWMCIEEKKDWQNFVSLTFSEIGEVVSKLMSSAAHATFESDRAKKECQNILRFMEHLQSENKDLRQQITGRDDDISKLHVLNYELRSMCYNLQEKIDMAVNQSKNPSPQRVDEGTSCNMTSGAGDDFSQWEEEKAYFQKALFEATENENWMNRQLDQKNEELRLAEESFSRLAREHSELKVFVQQTRFPTNTAVAASPVASVKAVPLRSITPTKLVGSRGNTPSRRIT
eukprot:PhF_6_TR25681/c0_g1_i1/m.36187